MWKSNEGHKQKQLFGIMNTLSDERLFDHFYIDLRYKVALRIQDLSEGDISISTLYNFRQRVVAYT